MWQTSPGHNANLLQSKADIVGVAVAHNEQTRYKTYWAMVIAQKPSKKERAQGRGTTENSGTPGDCLVAAKIRAAKRRAG